MNRIVINMDAQGGFTVFSDEPVELFVVCDSAPNDRVYQMEIEVGVQKVRDQLRDDPVGHKNDSNIFGSGLGPRKPPSRRKFEVVK